MARPTRRQVTEAWRRRMVAALYSRGSTIPAIIEELKTYHCNVSQAVVTRDIKAVRSQWEESAKEAIEVRKERELAALDLVQEEAWRGWLRSQSASTEETTKIELAKIWDKMERKGTKKEALDKADKPKIAKKLEPIKETTSHKTNDRDGNPAFLQVMTQTIEIRLRALGILKPGETNVNVSTTILQGWQELREAAAKQQPIIVEVPPVSIPEGEQQL